MTLCVKSKNQLVRLQYENEDDEKTLQITLRFERDDTVIFYQWYDVGKSMEHI